MCSRDSRVLHRRRAVLSGADGGLGKRNKEKEDKEMTAYCVKCRRKVTPEQVKKVTVKGGRHAIKGKCPICGTTVMRFTK